nr:unnamed protein product [Spirometra erinaceieuropaei]
MGRRGETVKVDGRIFTCAGAVSRGGLFSKGPLIQSDYAFKNRIVRIFLYYGLYYPKLGRLIYQSSSGRHWTNICGTNRGLHMRTGPMPKTQISEDGYTVSLLKTSASNQPPPANVLLPSELSLFQK